MASVYQFPSSPTSSPSRNERPSPALTYLARLSSGSRRVQAQALRTLASLLWPSQSPSEALSDPTLWGTLTPDRCVAVTARLRAERAPATAARIVSALRGTVREAWRLGLVDVELRDRLADLPPTRSTRLPRGRCLTTCEVDALFRVADARDGALLSALLGGGLRRQELASLRPQDIALARPGNSGFSQSHSLTPLKGVRRETRTPTDETKPTLEDTASAMAYALRLVVLGKGDKQRIVYIAGAHAQRIIAWLGELPPDAPSVFGLRAGAGVWKAVDRLRRRAGVAPFSPHDLRRTFASQSLDAGVDLATVQAAMGHADPRTTSRYDRRGERALEDAAHRLASQRLTAPA